MEVGKFFRTGSTYVHLWRIKSAHENIGYEVKLEPYEDIHLTGAARGRSVAGRNDCKAHDYDIVRIKPKLTEKMRWYEFNKL